MGQVVVWAEPQTAVMEEVDAMAFEHTEQRKHSETLEPPVSPLAMPGSIRLTLRRKSSNTRSRAVLLIAL